MIKTLIPYAIICKSLSFRQNRGELERILRKEKTGNLKRIAGFFYMQKVCNLYANIFWRFLGNKKSPIKWACVGDDCDSNQLQLCPE